MVVRYIHQLPVRMGQSQHVNLARWTSHLSYLGDERHGPLVDRDVVIELVGGPRDGALRAYQSQMSQIAAESDLTKAYIPEDEIAESSADDNRASETMSLGEIAEFIEVQTGVRLAVMRSKSRSEQVVEARRLFIAVAVMLFSFPVSEVAKYVNVHHSYVSRLTFPKNEAARELTQAAEELAATLGVDLR